VGAFFTLLLLAVSTGAGPGQLAGQGPDVGPPVATDTVPDARSPVATDTVPDAPSPVATDTVPDARSPVATDTVPDAPSPVAQVADTVAPEPEPPPALPAIPAIGPSGWDVGVWEWSRTDLLRLPDLSLLHLLERIPGVTPVRVASVGQPEGAAVFGATVGAITYEVDGFELDPLTAPTFDPSRFPLVALESVRVERRVTGARVRIRTVSPGDARPLSVIEAGTGDLRTNLFRGTFLAPRVLGGGLSFGFESLGSQTIVGGESNFTGGWLKWTWAREEGGVQVEYRQSGMDRAGTGVALSGQRRDWVVRARRHLGPVVAEGYAGASSVEDEAGDVVLREGAPQGGIRLSTGVVAPFPVEATGALRLRSHPRLPAQEAEVSVWAAPVPWLGFGMEGAEGRRAEGPPTGRWALRGRVGPVAGLTAFADLARDRHALVRTVPDPGTAEPDPIDPDDPTSHGRLDLARNGARAGLQFQYGTLRLGAAALRTSADSAVGFGLAFDPTAPRFAGGEATGVEVTVRAPTGWAPLRVEGWYVGMEVPPAGLYLPADQWRAALVYHHLPLPTGNLELYGRAEHRYRGPMLVPADGGAAAVAEHQSTHLEVTIRVLTVRAFVRWDNVLNRPFQKDVPGYDLPGQHVVYGVKWEFWN
jgi:hypothetical protein